MTIKKKYSRAVDEAFMHIFSQNEIIKNEEDYRLMKFLANAGSADLKHIMSILCFAQGEDEKAEEWESKAQEDYTYRIRSRLAAYHDYFDSLKVQIDDVMETERILRLMEISHIPANDSSNMRISSKSKVTERISAKITNETKELARSALTYGQPLNLDSLEKLINYINQFIPDENLQKKNSKNIKNLYNKLLELYPLDSEDWHSVDINIYTKDFKDLCKIQIELPIEGNVTGIYFWERYCNENYDESSNSYQECEFLKLEYKPSWFNNVEADSLKSKKKKSNRRNDKNRPSSYISKLYNVYRITLEEYSKDSKNKLEDLLEYVEYDFLSIDEMNEPNKIINIFALLKDMGWHIFEDLPNQKIEQQEAFIFLKSELMRECEISDLLILRIDNNRLKMFMLNKLEGIVYGFLNNAIAGIDTTYYDGTLLEFYKKLKERTEHFSSLLQRLKQLEMENCYDNDSNCKLLLLCEFFEENIFQSDIVDTEAIEVEKIIEKIRYTKSENLHKDFLKRIQAEHARHSLKERTRNYDSLLEMPIKVTEEQAKIFKNWILEDDVSSTKINDTKQELNFIKFLDVDKSTFEKIKAESKLFLHSLDKNISNTPFIIMVLIYQLLYQSEEIKMQSPKYYQNKRNSERTLKSLIKYNTKKDTGTKHMLSYLLERQFYYNLSQGEVYEEMMRFRLVLEKQLSDLFFMRHSEELEFEMLNNIFRVD